MIEKEKHVHREAEKEIIENTISGKVDDIVQKKSPVEIKDIFEGVPEDHKVVLIEGAPGAGKSSLSLDICQKWSEGELFQEYKAVILVRLRDPHVQEATTIGQLLPYRDGTTPQQVASEIETVLDRDVLWVLDGWDELPVSLKKESSLLRQIISFPQMSAVIVTSRPASSVKLHPIVSKRIAVLGFTPEDLAEYFMKRLKDSERVKILLEKIEDHPEVESSCYLPLHASFIVDTFLMNEYTFPTTQYGIFESVVTKCISRYQIKQGKEKVQSLDEIPNELKPSFKNVCHLAYQGILENKIIFTESDLPSDFKSLDLLQEVESMHKPFKTYNFLHLSIQDFLAAQHFAVKEQCEHVWLFKSFMDDPRCWPMLKFYSAKTKLSVLGIAEYCSGISEDVVTPWASDEKLTGYETTNSLLILFECICEAEYSSICEPLAKSLNGKFFSSTLCPDFELSDYYSTGSFLSLSSTTDVGGQIKMDFPQLCEFNDQECKIFIKGMFKCLKDTTRVISPLDIDFSSRVSHISDVGASYIVKVLRDTKLFHTLRINPNAFEPSAMNQILHEGVQHSSSLNTLQLNYGVVIWQPEYVNVDGFTDVHGRELEQMLQNNCSLECLNIHVQSHQILKSSFGLPNIVQGLQKNNTLLELCLSNCGITSEVVETLSEVLNKNKTLQRLMLHFNTMISDDGAKFIANGLRNSTTLRELDLRGCGITSKGAKALSDALLVNKTLNVLVLSFNKLSDDGASYLLNALKTNYTLEKLHMHGCGVKTMETRLVTDILLGYSSTSVDTINTSILINALKRKCRGLEVADASSWSSFPITELDISVADDKGAEVLKNIIDSKSSLEILSIICPHISVDGFSCITSALSINKSLKVLHIHHSSKLPHKEKLLLSDALEMNTNLQELRIANYSYLERENLQDRVNNARMKTRGPTVELKVLEPLHPDLQFLHDI